MDKVITHVLVWSLSVHVSLELEGGSLGVALAAVEESVLVEGVGAMGVAGTAGSLGGSAGKTGWHISVSAQSALCIDVFKVLGLPVEIMMVSIMFEKQMVELIDLSPFCFVMSVFLYFVDKQLASM